MFRATLGPVGESSSEQRGWKALGAALKLAIARRPPGRRTNVSLGLEIGLSDRMVGSLARGERNSYSDSTLFAVDQYMGWAPGTARGIGEGRRDVPTYGAHTGARKQDEDHQATPVTRSDLEDVLEAHTNRLLEEMRRMHRKP